MASIRKRGESWTVEVRRKGIFKSSTFPTKAQAQAWAVQTEAEILAGKTGSIPNKTFGDLLTHYAENVSVKKRGNRWEQVRIAKIKRDDIAQVKLCDLSSKHFADWRDNSLKTLAGSSVKRERNLLSNVISIAIKELGWLHDNPLKGVKMPSSPRARDRIFSDDDIEKLLFTLGYDSSATPKTIGARIGCAMLFAIETGMRAGEICALLWRDVHLDKSYLRVSGELVGAGKTDSARRDVSLSPEAMRLLKQLGTDEGSVFNLTTTQIDSNFRKAKSKALIDDLHFHDTRGTACTRLARKLNILELARMIGHKDLRMLQVYFRDSAEETAKKLG